MERDLPAVGRELMQHDLAAMRALLSPRRRAIWAGGRWWTYAELDQRAARLAGALRARGIGKGERVAILALNHLAHFDLLLAAPKLGFIPVPFNYRLSAQEQRQLADQLRPRLLLHDEEHTHLAAATGAPLQPLAAYEDWLASAEAISGQAALDDGDTALILLTGGSTGLPKGAMLPYRQLFYNAVNTVMAWGLGAEDCAIQAAPAFHAAVNVLSTPLLHAGGRVVLQRSFAADEYLQLATRHRASVLFMVPTMFQMLAESPEFGAADLSSVRWAISGGAPCPDPIRAPYLGKGIRFKQGYGMTEAGVNCFAIELDDAESKPQAVGTPMPHAQAVIRDPQGRPVPAGVVGELTLAGPHVFSGYFSQPEATAAVLKAGWLWTGDLAVQDDQGLFRITGRRKEMFISGGENVYPAEVEAALYEQAEVAECAVLGVPHPRWGETGLAAVVPRSGAAIDTEILVARLKDRLASYKVPRQWLLLDALPKSGAGKVLKPAIKAQYEAELGA